MRYRQIHLDFHTSPVIEDVGADFNAEDFVKILIDAHVNSVNIFAKCHHGMCYYPTKIGVMHPSLEYDLMGKMIDVLHANNIKCPIYFPADKPAEAKAEKSHLKVAPITWLFGVIIFVFINSYGVMGANIAFIITDRGFGGPELIGTAMAIFLVGGMVGGLLFNPFEKKMHELVLINGFICLIIGFLVIYVAPSLLVMYVGAFIVGLSIGFEMPGTLLYATNYNTVEAATAGCAVIHMAGQLGTVCSALFYTPVSSAIKPGSSDFVFLFGAICCAIFAVLTGIAVTAARKKLAK